MAFQEMLSIREKDENELKLSYERIQKTVLELEMQKFALDQHSIVAMTDMQGNITFTNDKFSQISGYSREELIGKNHRILNSGRHDKAFFEKMYQTVSNGQVWHGEVCNRNKKGELYWVDTTIVPLLGDNKKPKSYIAIRTDITEHKLTELELINAKDSAEQAVEAKSEFLSSMSHEIRTPMNGVLGMLGLLLNTQLDDEQFHQATIAQSSAQSLLSLINDILDFSKVDAEKLELEYLDFDLATMLGEFTESMAFRAQEKNLELILDMREVDIFSVKGDLRRIRQILTNLVGNAIKFTSEGEVVIQVALKSINKQQLQLQCRVTDSGIGIPAQKQSTLFNSFTQVDASTTRKYGGSGLGLAIAKKLCELMGGDISVESIENQGSRFNINILLEKSSQPRQVIPQMDMTQLHILIVDDNATNGAVLRGQLQRWGATVELAASGQEALLLCEQRIKETEENRFDIAFLDMQMPEMDGASLGKKLKDDVELAASGQEALLLCEQRIKETAENFFDIAFLDMQMPEMDGASLGKKLKDDPRFSQIKLIMMTSMNMRGDDKYFSDLGFSGYFPKPAIISDLFHVLSVGDTLLQADSQLIQQDLKILKQPKKEIMVNIETTNHQAWPDKTRLLLVEDNQVNQLVAKGLLKIIGLQADVVASGLEALHSLQQAPEDYPYTVVLMDCLMPEMDGYEASSEIRRGNAGERNKLIPIIAMTANAMHGDKEKCLQAGMSDYLSKPIEHKLLKEKLQQWLTGLDEETSVSESVGLGSMGDGKGSNKTQEAELAVWDEQDALARVLEDEAFLIVLIGVFLMDTPEQISELELAINSKDFKKIKYLAHTIKGSAANLSCLQLHQQALLMEMAAKAVDISEIKEILPNLLQACDQLILCFEQYKADRQPLDDQPELLANTEFTEYLRGLELKLQQNDFIDQQELLVLNQVSLDPVIVNLIEQLQGQISQFDNVTALKTLMKIAVKTNCKLDIES